MTSLWDVVGPEIDGEYAALRMTRAKVACASLWPFLARAEDHREFEHRLELAGEHIAARVDEDLLEAVTASLRTDFLAITRTAFDEDTTPEAGPATGETGGFPLHPTGADPMDPINAEYPVQPQPWTVAPGTEWKEAPMQFGASVKTAEIGDDDTCRACGQAVKYVKADGIPTWSHTGPDGWAHDDQHLPHPQRYPYEAARGRHPFVRQATEGVVPTPGPNPHFFDAGEEGVAGEQSGFPADVSQAPEDWVDSYGTVPPTRSQGVTAHRFYDPMVSGLQFTAVGEGDPFGSGNPFASGGTTEGGVPPTPPSLDGGPGSSAQMADGGVPQTTSPRQMPSGGGGMGAPSAPEVPQGNTPAPSNPTTGSLSFAAFMRTAESQELFSEERPTGLADPFQETQFERARNSRPRMTTEQMGINTPQTPGSREPIRTVTSDPSGVRDEDDEEEER